MTNSSDKQRDAASGPATLAPFPTVAQFTREEGVSRSTLARLATAGKIEVFKVGRSTRVNRASWRAFVAACPRATYRVDGRRQPQERA
jgi:excisionase family DNA binding protein